MMELLKDLLEQIKADNLFDESVCFDKNEYVKVAGSIDTNLYYIEKGALIAYMIDKFEEHIVCIGYQNEMALIMDVESFFTEKPSEYYIQAIKKTQVKLINKKLIKQLLNKYPQLNESWNEFLYQIILIMAKREKEIFSSTPEERYKNLICRSPQLFQEIPSKYIASYLRMAPETLSRIKKY